MEWFTDTLPVTPEPDPCDSSVTSAVVLVQTGDGSLYTAQWTVYTWSDDEEPGFDHCWPLCGRDGLQLERSEVVAWSPIRRYNGAPA